MNNLKIYLVSYDRLEKRVIEKLSLEERQHLTCYSVNKSVLKMFSTKLPVINEWELDWYSPRFQSRQYYEYGTIIHAVKNPNLLNGLSHVGLMHYDMLFPENSINFIKDEIEKNPRQIFYVVKRNDSLYFTDKQLKEVCNYLNDKLGINSSPESIYENGWISEALSVTPVDIFTKFGQFLIDNHTDIENMLLTNRWGLMDHCNHRICGIVERFWGIYLVSCGLPITKSNIIHDWDYYKHEHLQQKNWIKR